MYIAVLLVSLMASGLLVGNEIAVALFLHPLLYSLPEQVHARVAKPLARRLGRFMPFWYALSLVFAILQLLVTSPADRICASQYTNVRGFAMSRGCCSYNFLPMMA